VGGAIIIPLYYLASLRLEYTKGYQPASRQINLPYAKALLPALFIGYLIPTALLYLPSADPNLHTMQFFVALWQVCPFFVNILASGLSWAFGTNLKSESRGSSINGLRYLNRVYLVSFAVTALLHIGTVLLFAWSSDPQLSFEHSFLISPINKGSSYGMKMHRIFQFDFWIIFAAALLWTFYSFWELSYIAKSKISFPTSFAGIILATVCLGPAAAISGAWYLREQLLAREEGLQGVKSKRK